MSTLQEIRTAIGSLDSQEKALLVAELFVLNETDDVALQTALDRGLADVKEGRVRSIEDVRDMIPQWTS